MHMANEQYQQGSHKWKTWQLVFQTFERYWASFQVTPLFHSATNFFHPGRLLEWRVFHFFFIVNFILGGEGGGGVRAAAQLQCIYYLVLYTNLEAAEGN